MGKAPIKFCKKCSGIKAKDLKGTIDRELWSEGCFGACRKRHPELKDAVYARVEGKVVAAPSKKKLVRKIERSLA